MTLAQPWLIENSFSSGEGGSQAVKLYDHND